MQAEGTIFSPWPLQLKVSAWKNVLTIAARDHRTPLLTISFAHSEAEWASKPQKNFIP